METTGEVYEFNDFQLKWLEALESGKYLQGKQKLKCDIVGQYEYCCLGVGCDLLGLPEKTLECGTVIFEPETEYASNLAPRKLVNSLRLKDRTGSIDSKENSLVKMNDGLDLSFKDIAKFCRENPEKVFVE